MGKRINTNGPAINEAREALEGAEDETYEIEGGPLAADEDFNAEASADSAIEGEDDETESDDDSESEGDEESDEPAFYEGLNEKIKTPEELKEYTKRLEKQLIEAQVRGEAPAAKGGKVEGEGDANAGAEGSGDVLSGINVDEFFAKPQETVSKLFASAKDAAKNEIRQELENEKYWKGFYSRYRDLAGLEEIVEVAYGKVQAEYGPALKAMSRAKAEQVLVEKARGIVKKARGGSGETLTDERPSALRSSGARGAGKAKPKKNEAPQTMADQITSFQRSKLRTVG